MEMPVLIVDGNLIRYSPVEERVTSALEVGDSPAICTTLPYIGSARAAAFEA